MSTQSKPIYLTREEYHRIQIYEKRYRNEARKVFHDRVVHYHPLTGGNYTSITIRDQKSRWEAALPEGLFLLTIA